MQAPADGHASATMVVLAYWLPFWSAAVAAIGGMRLPAEAEIPLNPSADAWPN